MIEDLKNIDDNGSGVVVDKTVISNKNSKKNTKKIPSKGVVINGFLNVRANPNSNSAVLKVLADASRVIILSETNENFYKVNAEGTIGYCMKRFIKKV